MTLEYNDGQIISGDIVSPVTPLLGNIGGLTEEVVSEIVRNANIGEFVMRKALEPLSLYGVADFLAELMRVIGHENREHCTRTWKAKA